MKFALVRRLGGPPCGTPGRRADACATSERIVEESGRERGPTSFAPLIHAAIDIVERSNGQYHVLVLIADGQVTRNPDVPKGSFSPQECATIDAIVHARRPEFPISVPQKTHHSGTCIERSRPAVFPSVSSLNAGLPSRIELGPKIYLSSLTASPIAIPSAACTAWVLFPLHHSLLSTPKPAASPLHCPSPSPAAPNSHLQPIPTLFSPPSPAANKIQHYSHFGHGEVQFVNFTKIMSSNMEVEKMEAAFALCALMEIPFQYKATQALRPIEKKVGDWALRKFSPLRLE
ncbi:E3 ubiquitin-protein ligase RGLG2 [Platanthera guangdongensis]|uniref:E3 ubiquitin-protein ligase RGLG2 n=1 Tax=Platanthera guangdongensis TaxID=2320717 RepID=A0ABR2MTS0_9ASPA